MDDDDDSGVSNPLVSGAHYRLFLKIAMLGTELREFACAEQIAQTMLELRPDLPHASISLGMNDFAAGRRNEGIRTLEATVERFPSSQLAKATLGVCLLDADRSGWQQLLQSVIDDGRDEYAIGLACVVLGRPNGYIDPTPSPEPVPSVPGHAMWA